MAAEAKSKTEAETHAETQTNTQTKTSEVHIAVLRLSTYIDEAK